MQNIDRNNKMGNNCSRNEQRPETYEKQLSSENDENTKRSKWQRFASFCQDLKVYVIFVFGLVYLLLIWPISKLIEKISNKDEYECTEYTEKCLVVKF